MTGSSSKMTRVTVKGLLDVNQYCKPAVKGRIVLLLPNGTEIGSVDVPVGTSFTGKVINFPANQYIANQTYCIAGEITLLNPAPQPSPPNPPPNIICGISYTNGNGVFEWSP